MARTAVLAIENAVFRYIKIEQYRDQQLEEQTAQLALKDNRMRELEAVQSDLHAALLAERERRASLKALRDEEDIPQQTAYLIESVCTALV